MAGDASRGLSATAELLVTHVEAEGLKPFDNVFPVLFFDIICHQ